MMKSFQIGVDYYRKDLALLEKGGKNENGRVTYPECVSNYIGRLRKSGGQNIDII